MRFYESPKRALFSIPFELAEGLVIGIKGYGQVTEQKKGAYKYFVDLEDRMEVVESRTTYVDEVRTFSLLRRVFLIPIMSQKEEEAEVDKSGVQFGMTLGATGEDEDTEMHGFGTRSVGAGRRVSTTPSPYTSFPPFPDVIFPSLSGLLHGRRSALFPHSRPRTWPQAPWFQRSLRARF